MAAWEVLGKAVGSRIVDVRTAIDRQATFVVGLNDPPPDLDVDTESVAREFVLRALRISADAVNYRIMSTLMVEDLAFRDLCSRLDVGHAAVWERVNDLIQAGLVARALEHDRTGLTPAGQGLVEFIESAADAAETVVRQAQT
jgi:DNA-binding HxlR family transcriptional regulator